MKLKNIPNAITTIRIILCIPIIFLPPLRTASIVLFILAGLTDMIDGPLARRIKDAQSELGETLDSVADMLLVFIGIFVLLPHIDTYSWIFPAYVIGLVFKVMSGFVGFFKHKEMVMLHTYSNKALALLLFSVPIISYFTGRALLVDIYIIFVFVCIFIITTEEILINLFLIKPSRDIKSIFGVKATNERFRKLLQEDKAIKE